MTGAPDNKPEAGRRMRRHRRLPTRWLALGDRLAVRIAARSLAVLFLGASISYAMATGDYLGDRNGTAYRLLDKLAYELGYAAKTVRISGLAHHGREAVLQAIDVTPDGSLIGFDPTNARRLLENLDWVLNAEVQLVYPNQLQISLKERKPFAIWQRDGNYYVIDPSGSAISSLNPLNFRDLLLVTGEGAQTAARELVNQLEARPGLRSRVRAAARVGDRRWTLYLVNGTKVLLPEGDIGRGLERLVEAEKRYGLEAKDVGRIDLRIAGEIILAPLASAQGEIKVSRR